MRRYFEDATPLVQILFSGFIVVVVFMIIFLLGLLSGLIFFDVNVLELPALMNDLQSPESLMILKYLQMVQAIGLFVAPPFVIAVLLSSEPLRYLSLEKKPKARSVFLAILFMIVAIPAINMLAALNAQMELPDSLAGVEEWMKRSEESAAVLMEAFLRADTIGVLLLNIFMIAILPGIGEELLFRGVLQPQLSALARSKTAGLFLAAFLFSAMHLQFYGFLPRFLLGLIFGYMLLWSGSLWLPVLAHFVNNVIAVIFYYYAGKSDINISELEELGASSEAYIYVLLSFVISAVLLWQFKKSTQNDTGYG